MWFSRAVSSTSTSGCSLSSTSSSWSSATASSSFSTGCTCTCDVIVTTNSQKTPSVSLRHCSDENTLSKIFYRFGAVRQIYSWTSRQLSSARKYTLSYRNSKIRRVREDTDADRTVVGKYVRKSWHLYHGAPTSRKRHSSAGCCSSLSKKMRFQCFA